MWWVIIEGDVAWWVIEVDGCDDQVGDWNRVSSLGDEREDGDEVVVAEVRLMVADYSRFVRSGRNCGRHCLGWED